MRLWAAAILLIATAPPAVLHPGGFDERDCGTARFSSPEALALHGYWSARHAPRARERAQDEQRDGHVVVLEDRGDLVAARNPFDLDGTAVRFSPRGGGYALARMSAALEPPGTRLDLAGDSVHELALPFNFPFYGQRHASVFVHSDGHLTFERADAGGGALGMWRFLTGPPRVGALFADLDPGRAGSVSVRLLPDRAVFLWSGVPGSAQINRNTFQVALMPSGEVELAWSSEVQTREAIVGIAPGSAALLTPADLSAAQPSLASGAIAERFSERDQLDLVSVLRRFYASWPDTFEQVVVYTSRPLNPLAGSLAFEINVSNTVAGIGLQSFDDSARWGSAGRLESVVFMDWIDTYLDVDGFEILAHEVGHRWLAQLRFRDPSGKPSPALLGRGFSHWSFFFDSDASVMEGNDIQDLGGGRFHTVDITRRYSPLDQYAMGLRPPEQVPPLFYVEAADDFRPNRTYKASSAPEAGVSFTGIRREVAITDIVAEMGPRQPPARAAQRPFRQAWILVSHAEGAATPERRAAANRIRSRIEGYFREATEGRGALDTTLP